jgi:hypothetical protein
LDYYNKTTHFGLNNCEVTSDIDDDAMNNIFKNSKCATDVQQKKYLYSIIFPSYPKSLLYNASADGWMSKDFYSRCSSKGPTLTLFKIKNGDCIGGYNPFDWY